MNPVTPTVLPPYDVLVFPVVDWNDCFQRPQHLCLEFEGEVIAFSIFRPSSLPNTACARWARIRWRRVSYWVGCRGCDASLIDRSDRAPHTLLLRPGRSRRESRSRPPCPLLPARTEPRPASSSPRAGSRTGSGVVQTTFGESTDGRRLTEAQPSGFFSSFVDTDAAAEVPQDGRRHVRRPTMTPQKWFWKARLGTVGHENDGCRDGQLCGPAGQSSIEMEMASGCGENRTRRAGSGTGKVAGGFGALAIRLSWQIAAVGGFNSLV